MVSGYSKSPIDKSLNIKLSKILDPYKKYKQYYSVGPAHEYKGSKESHDTKHLKKIIEILTLN